MERPRVVVAEVAHDDEPADREVAPVLASKEPDRFLQTARASLTGADLSAWRSRLGLTQQAAADRLGVRQGTVSKAESKGATVLGEALHDALADALRAERRPA